MVALVLRMRTRRLVARVRVVAAASVPAGRGPREPQVVASARVGERPATMTRARRARNTLGRGGRDANGCGGRKIDHFSCAETI